MSPLEAIDGTQIPFFPVCQALVIQKGPGCIAVPDADLLIAQVFCVSVSFQEPDQLLCNTSPEHILSRQHRETFTQVVAHLTAEFGKDTRTSPIILLLSCLNHLFDIFEILHLRVPRIHLHEFGWDQIWPLTEKHPVTIEDVIECDLVLGLGSCLGDVEWVKPVFERRHEDVRLEIFVNSCCYD